MNVTNDTQGENQALADSVREVTNELGDLQESVKNLMRATDTYVRQHAWASVGLAAALGLSIGLLIGGPSASGKD